MACHIALNFFQKREVLASVCVYCCMTGIVYVLKGNCSGGCEELNIAQWSESRWPCVESSVATLGLSLPAGLLM